MIRARHWPTVLSRIAAAVFGGYFFAFGFTALVVAVNLAAGGKYSEGLLLAYLLAFAVYLAAFLWAFAARRLALAWLVLAGGGAAMTLAAAHLAGMPALPG